jgi:nucleoside-diphosphate-sugar epimerase
MRFGMEVIDNKKNAKKTVIIFGGAGYVGRYFVKYLLENNVYDRIIIVTRNISKKMFFRDDRVEVYLNLNNFRVKNCLIYNFAVSVAVSFRQGLKNAEILVNNIFNSLKKDFDGEIIHISSIAVYDIKGNDPSNPKELKKITKDDVYTYIKAKTEQLIIKKANNFSVNYRIFRIGNVIGPGSTWVNKIVERLIEQQPLFGKKINYPSNTSFVGNLVFMLANYEKYINKKQRIYNFCEFGNVSWKEWIDNISAVLKVEPRAWDVNSYSDFSVGIGNDIKFIKTLVYKDVVTNALKLPSLTKYVLRGLNYFDADKIKSNAKKKVNSNGNKAFDVDLQEYKMAKIYKKNYNQYHDK